MARIQITSEESVLGRVPTVTLSEPDEDGDYSWTCNYGHAADAYRPIDEAVADAGIHVDHQCR